MQPAAGAHFTNSGKKNPTPKHPFFFGNELSETGGLRRTREKLLVQVLAEYPRVVFRSCRCFLASSSPPPPSSHTQQRLVVFSQLAQYTCFLTQSPSVPEKNLHADRPAFFLNCLFQEMDVPYYKKTQTKKQPRLTYKTMRWFFKSIFSTNREKRRVDHFLGKPQKKGCFYPWRD